MFLFRAKQTHKRGVIAYLEGERLGKTEILYCGRWMILNLRPDACQCCCVVVVGEEELERGEQPRAARRRAWRAVILGRRRRQRHGEESRQAGREHSTYWLAIQLHRVIQVMR